MTFTIDLPQATVDRIHVEAQASGKDVETFVREAVEAKLGACGRSLRQILEPLHREVEASGISEDQLGSLIDEEIAAMRAERKTAQSQQ